MLFLSHYLLLTKKAFTNFTTGHILGIMSIYYKTKTPLLLTGAFG